jgi:DNA polymerase/3'-5' exonuclease PolX
MYNLHLITLLQILARYKKILSNNPFQQRAYTNTINQIAKLKHNLTLDDIKNLDIGAKMQKKLIEYIKSPSSLQNEINKLAQSVNDVLRLSFLFGFGEKFISNLIKKFGPIGIQDVKRLVNEGKISLNPTQIKSLKYADKIRIPYTVAELAKLEKVFLQKINKELPDVELFVVGSYRRHKTSPKYKCKDIDVVFYSKKPISAKKVYDVITKNINVNTPFVSGDEKVIGLILLSNKNGPYIQLDVFRVKDKYAGLIYGTGGAQFNIKLRSAAKTKGLTFNQNGLFDNKTGKQIKFSSEAGYIKFLLGYNVPPSKR